jgi:hypothetical protein
VVQLLALPPSVESPFYFLVDEPGNPSFVRHEVENVNLTNPELPVITTTTGRQFEMLPKMAPFRLTQIVIGVASLLVELIGFSPRMAVELRGSEKITILQRREIDYVEDAWFEAGGTPKNRPNLYAFLYRKWEGGCPLYITVNGLPLEINLRKGASVPKAVLRTMERKYGKQSPEYKLWAKFFTVIGEFWSEKG